MNAGYKDFADNNIIVADDVNSYLMSQAVMTFDNAIDRDAALTSPSQGMQVFLADTNTLWYYTTTWQSYPLGQVYKYQAGGNAAGTPSTTEIALYTTGSFNVLASRKYRVSARGVCTPSAVSTSGSLRFRVRAGSGTGGTILANNYSAQSTTTSIAVFGEGTFTGGSEIASGSTVFTLCAVTATGSASWYYTSGQTATNTELIIEDLGA